MQIFNLQIHKSGDLAHLYKEVDNILTQKGVVRGGVSECITKEAIAHSLQEMIKGDWFNVCKIDRAIEAAKIFNVFICSERRNIYNMAHCIHWRDMTESYRNTLIAMIMDDFRELFIKDNKTERN